MLSLIQMLQPHGILVWLVFIASKLPRISATGNYGIHRGNQKF